MNNESLSQALRAAISLALILIVSYGFDIYQMIAPFSATCALLAVLPTAPFSKPKTLVLSHSLCIAVGMAMSFSPLPVLVTVLVAAWISIMLMAGFKVMHAPAVAHTSIWCRLRLLLFSPHCCWRLFHICMAKASTTPGLK
jgi:CBS-domain-containing membrane protein